MLEIITRDLTAYTRKQSGILDVIVGFFRFSGFRAVTLYRLGNYLINKNFRVLAFIMTRLIRATCNVDIEVTARIGVGLRMPHPYAIVIGGNVVIGDGCTIMQCVTLGGNGGKSRNGITQPKLGEGVLVGPGAKLLGPVVIGNRARIGANAVVLDDVPESGVAVGVPAKVRSIV